MLGQLDLIADSEYNNAGDLLGIDPMNINGELLGALKAMNPIARQKVINNLAKNPAPSKGSRAEMEKHFRELQPHIKNELAKGNLRLADTIIYSIKPVTSRTVKIFETQDDKEVGVRNISNAKLPKNQSLLVSGIILLVGTAAGASKDDMMATNYDKIESFPAIANGEFSLKANKKTIIPEIGNYVFKTQNNHLLSIGYYKLANPRLIQDDVQIEMTIELGTTTGVAANTYVFAALHGTSTIP
jgi:hypothetical protein